MRARLEKPVVLFDGLCRFCDGAVVFVLARDPRGLFRFSPLGSAWARHALSRLPDGPPTADSLVLLDGDRCWIRSDAALRITQELRWPWPLLGVLRLVPRPLRDAAYDLVARNRGRWFGRLASCRLPTPELSARFLER